MALKLTDRVVETTQTTGTGVIDLLGAQTGFRTFRADLTSGDTTPYVIVDDPNEPTAYEYGIGTFTEGSPDTLARTTIHGSSNGGNAISLQSGQTYVVTGSPIASVLLTTQDKQSSPTDTTPGRLPVLFDIGGGVGAIGGDVIQGGVLREIVVIPYDVDPGTLPDWITKNSAGSYTLTTPSWLKFVRARGVAGGPGGGGVDHSGTSDRGAAASGGGASGLFDFIATAAQIGSSVILTVGDKGAGGSGDNTGSEGGTTSFGSLASSTSGQGGAQDTDSVFSVQQGGRGGGVSYGSVEISLTPSAANDAGEQGGHSLVIDGSPRFSGGGGSTIYGGGGYSNADNANNIARDAVGYGAAGGGGNRTSSGTLDGGSGQVGCIEIQAYG